MGERRREPRIPANLAVRIRCVDAHGTVLVQHAQARNISNSGALLTTLDDPPRIGDLVAVEYAGKTARFRIIWVRDSASHLKIQAAVQRLQQDECPWKELLSLQHLPV
jgi:hypothetical protein